MQNVILQSKNPIPVAGADVTLPTIEGTIVPDRYEYIYNYINIIYDYTLHAREIYKIVVLVHMMTIQNTPR